MVVVQPESDEAVRLHLDYLAEVSPVLAYPPPQEEAALRVRDCQILQY